MLSLDVHRLPPDRIIAELADAGLELTDRTIREPVGRERHQQAFLLATRAHPAGG